MKKHGRLCPIAFVLILASCSGGSSRRVALRFPTPATPPAESPPPAVDHVVPAPQPEPPDSIGILIAEAEEHYAAGLAHYRAGNLEQARVEFDRALELLLESGLELPEQERLRNKFDQLVDAIHSLEVAAVERGDVLSEQRYEPAPIESFAGLTFPVDPKISQKVQEELKTVRSDLPLVSNDIVNGVIAYLQGRGSGFIKAALKRIGEYQPLYAEVLRKEGLPQDLVYLAAAESAFNPFARSRAGATGIWQLMLGRGIEYGLRRDRWVDERQDPVKSTVAAAGHLKDLYQMFGDWYLAMAAYNCGPVAVQKAIEKTGYADFWTLHRLRALPVDTENYVPVIIATALIAKDPKAYGFEIEPDPPMATDPVVVSVPTDLRLIAQLIDRPVEELIRLNPALLRWTTPANDPAYVLRLPQGLGPVFEEAIARIPPDKRIWWRAHKVESGDTLASLARKFRVTTAALASANHLEPRSPLPEGARLVLPMAPGSEASLARVRERGPRRPIRYRVKPGDTLERIADRFDVTPYQIRKWNKLAGSPVRVGRNLKIYVAAGGSAGLGKSRTRRPAASASARGPRKRAVPAKTPTRASTRAPSPSAPSGAGPTSAR